MSLPKTTLFAPLVLMLAALFPLRAEPAPLMRDFMGVNGHLAFRPGLYRPLCGLVRNYHPMDWDLGGDPSSKTDLPMARNMVDWEKVYGGWKKDGFSILASLQFESIKAPLWKNPGPDAYAYGKAFARCFGPSHRNLVPYAEIGNEPYEWDAASFRLMFENLAKGLRAGDPSLKIVATCCNAAKPDRYSRDVAKFAGLEGLYDVLNVHTYSMIEGWPTWKRVYPEHPDIPYLKIVDDLLRWRDAHAGGKEVWVTEFGYDAGSGMTGTGTFAKWVSSTETEQAQWIVRSFLLFAAMGVDRAYVYYYDDQDKPQFHASSGLTRNFVPKPAYHAMAHLYRTLGNYRFSRIITKETGKLYLFEFVDPKMPGEPIWVAWSPTGSQEAGERTISVEGRVSKVERMPLTSGGAEGIPFSQKAARVTLPISESPVYLHLLRP